MVRRHVTQRRSLRRREGLEAPTLTSVLPLVSFIDGLKGASASVHTLDPQSVAIVRKGNDALTAWQSALDLRARYRSVAK